MVVVMFLFTIVSGSGLTNCWMGNLFVYVPEFVWYILQTS